MLDNKLLEVINKLQETFFTIPDAQNLIKLPQIIMVGAQSTGKSSTLESIVHHSFLPSGKGIVTRCPLVIQLINCPLDDKKYRKAGDGTEDNEEWGEFTHKQLIFFDFDEIRQEIERQTNVIAGSNKGISTTAITLRIFSPHVVNLTLVDLPGLIKVSVGDQPEDIEDQTKGLIMEYAKNPNSIILAISSAEADLATSESLKIAKEVDPEGKRTLAVLTKLDRMEDSEEGIKILSGKSNINIPVKLGVIGIINRGQGDGKKVRSAQDQREFEKKYLESKYPSIANRHGVLYLEKSLSKLLMSHIQDCLPQLIERIRSMKQEYEKLLRDCGEEIVDRDTTLTQIVINFMKSFCNVVDGKFDRLPVSLLGGASLRQLFFTTLRESFESIRSTLTVEEIVNELHLTGKPFQDVSDLDDHFSKFYKKEIIRLKDPSLKCAENVKKEIEKIIDHLVKEQHELQRFPALMHQLKSMMMRFLINRMPLTLQYIKDIFETELSCVNILMDGFHVNKINKAVDEKSMKSNWSHRLTTANKIFSLTQEYIKLEKKKIEDSVPKSIMFSLVNYMKDNSEAELLSKLLKISDNLLSEHSDIIIRRNSAKEMVKILQEAENNIENVYEVSI